MNIKLISRYVGIALAFEAIFMFLSVGVSLLYGTDAGFSPLLISAVITMLFGAFPLIFVHSSGNINLREGFAIMVLSWVLSCIFAMFPYLLYGGEFTMINAWFESVSGITTTGATILTDIEALPPSLLFWRSSTHYLGGIGVVIFMLMLLPSSSLRTRMYKIEVSVLSKENYQYKTQQSVRIIGSVYVILTVVTILALYLAGMPLFDAVNHAFTIVATGGLSTKNLSIAHYNSPAIEAVCAVMMLISSLHFGLLYLTVAKRSLKIFKSPIIRFYLGSLLIVTVLVTLNLRWEDVAATWGEAFRFASFHVISFASTCGLANADSSHWPLFSIFLLMYISMQCACSGSTTGGIKVDRVWILLQSFRGHLRKMLHPSAVIPIKIGNHVVDADFVSRVSVYVLMYILCIFLGAVLLSMTGLDLMDSLSASIASMGNVGPGFGSCGALDSFGHFSAVAKFVLALQMLFGRLEIFALLLIFVIFKRNA